MSHRMSESQVEQALVKAVKQRGGIAYKFTSPGVAGVPDRLVLLPQCPAAFVELKAPGQKPRPLQVRRFNQIKQLGHAVFIVDHPSQIVGVLDEIQATRLPDRGN